MVTKTKPVVKPKQKKKPAVKPKPKTKKTTGQKVDEFVSAASKIGTVAGSANTVITLLEKTGLLEKIKQALVDKKRQDQTYTQLVDDLRPVNAIPGLPQPVDQPVPDAQPTVVSQPIVPIVMSQPPVQPDVTQQAVKEEEFFTPRSSVSENVYPSITQLKLL